MKSKSGLSVQVRELEHWSRTRSNEYGSWIELGFLYYVILTACVRTDVAVESKSRAFASYGLGLVNFVNIPGQLRHGLLRWAGDGYGIFTL